MLPPAASINDSNKFTLCGIGLCPLVYQRHLGISMHKWRVLKRHILQGDLEPCSDLRENNPVTRPKVQLIHAHAWLNWAYEFLAEDLATSENPAKAQQIEDDNDDFLEIPWHVIDPSILGRTTLDPVNRTERFLSPGRLQELYELYVAMSDEGHAARTTFNVAYRLEWRKCLKFREHSEHAKCHQCALFSKLRQLAQTAAQKENALNMHIDHVRGMYADRAHYARLQTLSVQSTKFIGGPVETVAQDSSVLTLSIDGMDQATRQRHATITQAQTQFLLLLQEFR